MKNHKCRHFKGSSDYWNQVTDEHLLSCGDEMTLVATNRSNAGPQRQACLARAWLQYYTLKLKLLRRNSS
jgi:hypothetical protein